MKRAFLIACCLVSACFQMSAWSRLGHSSIAEIAENHLTPKARKAVNKYLNGEHMATFASIPDEYRKELDNMGLVAAHTYSVDGECQSCREREYKGTKVVNCLLDIDRFANDLYENQKSMNDTVRACEIIILVHIVGDMHCPGHVRYYPEFDAGYYDVMFNGQKSYFHGMLDSDILTRPYPWSFSDIAKICDVLPEGEIREIVSGDQYAWGHEHALNCIGIRSVPENGDVDGRWINDQTFLTRQCICNAGYRLAHILNIIFDKGYARTKGGDFMDRIVSAGK